MVDRAALEPAFRLRRSGDFVGALESVQLHCGDRGDAHLANVCFEQWVVEAYTSRANIRQFWDSVAEEVPKEAASNWNDPRLVQILETGKGRKAIENWLARSQTPKVYVRSLGLVDRNTVHTNIAKFDLEALRESRQFITLLLNTGAEISSYFDVHNDRPVRMSSILKDFLYYIYRNKAYELKNSKSHVGVIIVYGNLYEVFKFPGFTIVYWVWRFFQDHHSAWFNIMHWMEVLGLRIPQSECIHGPDQPSHWLVKWCRDRAEQGWYLLLRLPLPIHLVTENQVIMELPDRFDLRDAAALAPEEMN